MSLAVLMMLAGTPVDVPPSEPWNRQISVDAHVGSGAAPYGVLGASAEWTVLPWLGVSAGAGSRGYQGSVGGMLVHLRAGDRFVRIGLASGASMGGYTHQAGSCSFLLGGCSASKEFGSQRLDRAWMLHNQLTLEGRTRAGVHIALGFGWARILNAASDWQCLDQCTGPSPTRDHAYFDLSVGWSFL